LKTFGKAYITSFYSKLFSNELTLVIIFKSTHTTIIFRLLVNMGDLPKPDVNTLTESFGGDNSGGVAAARPPPENHESVLPPSSTRDHYAEYQQQMILQQYQMQMQMQGDPGLSAMYDNLSGPTPDLNQGQGQGQGTTQKRKAETHEDEPLHQRATDK